MFTYTIRSAGRYTQAESNTQQVGCTWLTFTASGQAHERLLHPDGHLLHESPPEFTGLGLRTAGMTIDFDYTTSRENWVVMMDGLPLKLTGTGLVLNSADGPEPVPYNIPIKLTSLSRWRELFKRLTQRIHSPLPRNRLLAKTDVAEALAAIIGYNEHSAVTPAGRLKQLLDDDVRFDRSLVELSEECGYSADHLRILFTAEFGISPGRYRMAQRMTNVMQLVSAGTMNVKEISAAAGFRHTSHLCKAFKDAYGITPAQGIVKYRYGK